MWTGAEHDGQLIANRFTLRSLFPVVPLRLVKLRRYRLFSVPLLVTFAGLSFVVFAGAAEFDFFEKKIRPVLVENCYECHSVESEKSKGGLLLDSREATLRGGDSGAAVVPGKPDDSWLLTAISHSDPDLEMPPKKEQLSKSVIADIEKWIRDGAVDPRDEIAVGKISDQPPVTVEAGREFWSFQAPKQYPMPKIADVDWAKKDLDRFVLAALKEAKLKPSADAGRVVLLRRVHFDLTGLPPSPGQVTAFEKLVEKADLDTALSAVVGELLESPRYGERWARHWMDVARFAESSGQESNLSFPHAWRYRDYAIDAFNDDVPFDRFLIEQIAGDLLPAESDAERARLLIATGFLAFGTKGLNEMNRAQFVADLADEQLDTVTRAVLAQSVACARCHDHKFDPFHMQDYYALAGVFRSTETFFGTWIDSENNVGGDLIILPPLDGQLIPNKSIPKEKVDEMNAKVAELNAREAEGRAAAQRAMETGKANDKILMLPEALRIIWTRGGLEGRLQTVDDEGNALPLCMGVMDREVPEDSPIFARGEVDKPEGKVARAFPRVIEIAGVEAPPVDGSGRLELAQWLTHAENPLTARVMANRVWHWLIGEGLVRSADNFGFSGERPSHPQLLDHLALKFVDGGWSVKQLVREIVLSRTYRQSSDWREAVFEKDPDNRLLWRAHKRRLEAEAIRDAMLVASGEIDYSRRPGTLVNEFNGQSISLVGFNRKLPRDLDGVKFRSVYLPVLRDRLPDVLDLFDFAEPGMVIGDRDTTNVPVQALYLLNSDFVQARAKALAERVSKVSGDRATQVEQVFFLCLGRPATVDEQEVAKEFFAGVAGEDAMMVFCQGVMASAEFRNLD